MNSAAPVIAAYEARALAWAEFDARAAAARAVKPVGMFSNAAMDMLRIAAFAGFDVKDLVRRIVVKGRRSKAWKFNVASVENMMGAMGREGAR